MKGMNFMPNEQIQTRYDPRNIEIAELLELIISSKSNGCPIVFLDNDTTAPFIPTIDPRDERLVVKLLNQRGHCVQLVHYPNGVTRATVRPTGGKYEPFVCIANSPGEAIVQAAIDALKPTD
jgi:hypothetical protein